MKRHTDFLALLHLAWGAIFALVGLAGFALTVGAIVIAKDSAALQVRSDIAAGLTAVVLGVLGFLALVWGLLHVWVGSALRRYQARGRLAALGLAVINLVLFPVGTALGAYACWVLLADESRKLYEHPSDAASA